MIVKSLSRKDTNFQQIIDYLHHDRGVAPDFSYLHNIGVNPDDISAIVDAFRENDAFRKRRKNGVVFYHEILSFSPKDAPAILRHSDLLRDVAHRYLQLRAPDALAVARPHIEKKGHIHIHFVISACEKGCSKTLRISKAEMENIKRDVRAFQLELYPEIRHGYHQNWEHQVENRRTHTTWQMQQRGEVQDRKERLKRLLSDALGQASSWKKLMADLKAKELSLYRRKGNIAGVVWQQKKYRFFTLIREEQTLDKVRHFNREFSEKQEAALVWDLGKQDKNFGIIELPMDWQRIKKDLEKMEAQESLLGHRKEKYKGLDIERELG